MRAPMACASLRLDLDGCLRARVGRHGIAPGELRAAVSRAGAALRRIEGERAEGKHAFLDLPADRSLPRSIRRYVRAKAGSYDTVLVLGIGGSALGTSAVAAALRPPFADAAGARPRLVVLDNIDPDWLSRGLATVDLGRSVVVVVSKSGGTPETAAQFLLVRDRMRRALGDEWRRRMLVVTDPEQGPLRAAARAEGIDAFPIPPAVGGRFSVLSAACLAPLALAGVDIQGLLAGAHGMERLCRAGSAAGPAVRLAAAMDVLRRKGMTSVVMMPYAQSLDLLADWYRQLLGESVGKRLDRRGRVVERGMTPIKALGATDQHSQLQLYVEGPRDKVILFLALKRFAEALPIPRGGEPAFSYLAGKSFRALYDAERQGTARSLAEAERPAATIELSAADAPTVGAFLLWMELKVAILGYLMDVDPYDQPGVERGKVLAREILSGRTRVSGR